MITLEHSCTYTVTQSPNTKLVREWLVGLRTSSYRPWQGISDISQIKSSSVEYFILLHKRHELVPGKHLKKYGKSQAQSHGYLEPCTHQVTYSLVCQHSCLSYSAHLWWIADGRGQMSYEGWSHTPLTEQIGDNRPCLLQISCNIKRKERRTKKVSLSSSLSMTVYSLFVETDYVSFQKKIELVVSDNEHEYFFKTSYLCGKLRLFVLGMGYHVRLKCS